MIKRNRHYIILGIVVIAFWVTEYRKPKPINWYESYSKYDVIPYGNQILYEGLPLIFDEGLKTNTENISMPGTITEGNYIFINNTFFPDESGLNNLLEYVSDGNNVFIASRKFNEQLTDTLGVEVNRAFNFNIHDSLAFGLTTNEANYEYNKVMSLIPSYFFFNDKNDIVPLGFVSDTLVNYAKIPFGEGYFFLHLNPLLFTNYHMLKNDNHRYVSAVLSHLPNHETLWDEYYKNRKNAIQKSRLSVIIATNGLRQAIYLAVIVVFIYMLFAAKRKQQMIPIVAKKTNDTLSFVHTIGELYYSEQNHQDIGLKRIEFFLAHIRKKYQIFPEKFDEDFCVDLHLKSGVDIEDIRKLANNFNIVKGVKDITDERIIEQEKLIERFYKKI